MPAELKSILQEYNFSSISGSSKYLKLIHFSILNLLDSSGHLRVTQDCNRLFTKLPENKVLYSYKEIQSSAATVFIAV